MSKVSKLLRDPNQFFFDMIEKRKHIAINVLEQKVNTAIDRVNEKFPNLLNSVEFKQKKLPYHSAKEIKKNKLTAKKDDKKIISIQPKGKPVVVNNEIDNVVNEINNLLPDWFVYQRADWQKKPDFVILALDEIATHILKDILVCEQYHIEILEIFGGLDDTDQHIENYAKKHTQYFNSMIFQVLLPLKNQVKAIILTSNHNFYQRLIIKAANHLGISCILIPVIHNMSMLLQPKSLPSANYMIVGQIQAKQFMEQGISEHYIYQGGEILSWKHTLQHSGICKQDWFAVLALDSTIPTILYDVSIVEKSSLRTIREQHRNHLRFILKLTEKYNFQLIIRGNNIERTLGPSILDQVVSSPWAVINTEPFLIVSDQEAVQMTDVTVSWDGGIVLTAIENCKGAMWFSNGLSEISEKFGICCVDVSNENFEEKLLGCLNGELEVDKESVLEIRNNYFCEEQNIAKHIQNILIEKFLQQSSSLSKLSVLERFSKQDRIAKVASEFGENALQGTHCYLKQLLNTSVLVQSNPKTKNIEQLYDVDLFIQWGIKPTVAKRWQEQVARILNTPKIVVEDGFIRSLDIGLSGEAGLSIIWDDTTAYYDAKRVSRLERLLQSDLELTNEQYYRADQLINKIIYHRISKYNHAPNLNLKIGHVDRPKILLIDQRYGDQSVEYGLANDASFDKMLKDAMNLYADHDIIIKQHPDAIKGGKQSYFCQDKLAFTQYTDHIFVINFDVNPYALLNLVDRVFVGTSGMGFEALMAGKKVHCYGVPFYAGWGMTQDEIKLERRTKARSIVEIFHFSYLESSRYFNPLSNHCCELEDLIDTLVLKRGW